MAITHSMSCTAAEEPTANGPVHFIASSKQKSPQAPGGEQLYYSHAAAVLSYLIACMTSNRNGLVSGDSQVSRFDTLSQYGQGQAASPNRCSDDLSQDRNYMQYPKDNTSRTCKDVLNLRYCQDIQRAAFQALVRGAGGERT